MQLDIFQKSFAGSFAYYKDGSTRPPVHQDPYVADLDGDGVDEVIFSGLETQPNTPSDFSPITVHIFGWKNGVFQDLSSQWLPSGAGDVMGVGSIEFSDFDNDGRTDIFLAAYADMSVTFSPYVLYNRDGRFEKVALPGIESWQHGSSTADINGDGFSDVFAIGYGSATAIYLGGPLGLTPCPFTFSAGSSDVVLGDFLGDGTTTAVIADYWLPDADTMLVKILIEDGKYASIQEIGALPAPILENLNTSNEESHDVRIQAVDFNADGLSDVVLYSRLGFDGEKWPIVSAVQLLQNYGNGEFVDVTTTKLKGYVSESMVTYAPLIRDFNQDGLVDFYNDGSTWGGVHNSASFLVQNSNGDFIDTARSQLSTLLTDLGGIRTSTVAFGPDGDFHLISLDIQDGIGYVYEQRLLFADREQSENLTGTALFDRILGKGGNDTIHGKGDGDLIDGGSGIDTALYSGSASEYIIKVDQAQATATVTDSQSNRDGSDSLSNIERLKFRDKGVALDVNGATSAGGIYRLYKATFDRTPDHGGLGYWIDRADNGQSAVSMAEDFVWSQEFQQLYGIETKDQYLTGSDITALVTGFYRNVLDRDPDQVGLNFYVGVINNQERTVGRVLAEISDSPENYAATIGLIQNGIQYDVWLG